MAAFGIFFSALIFGALLINDARKYHIKLLHIAGIQIACIGTFFLGPLCDFFSLSFTEKNLDPIWLYALLSYTSLGPGVILAFFIGSELLIPQKKKIMV